MRINLQVTDRNEEDPGLVRESKLTIRCKYVVGTNPTFKMHVDAHEVGYRLPLFSGYHCRALFAIPARLIVLLPAVQHQTFPSSRETVLSWRAILSTLPLTAFSVRGLGTRATTRWPLALQMLKLALFPRPL